MYKCMYVCMYITIVFLEYLKSFVMSVRCLLHTLNYK